MKIAFLPLDDRPSSVDYIEYLGRISGIEIEILKSLALVETSFSHVDAAVLALDRWIYGGLVESRIFEQSFEAAFEKLDQLKIILDAHPIPVYAYSILMRQAPSAFSEEEALLADKIKEASIERSRRFKWENEVVDLNSSPVEKFSEVISTAPEDLWNQYLSARKRNHAVNQRAITLVAENRNVFLAIPLDDLTEEGLNQKEKKILEDRILHEKLQDRTQIFPGTDETGLLLLVRAVLEKERIIPRVFPVYDSSDPDQFRLKYEDCKLTELVSLQLKAIGAILENESKNADFFLFVHVPQENQIDVPLNPALKYSDEWIHQLKFHLAEGIPCALADLRYANGSDKLFMRYLSQEIDFSKLLSFSAWNTSANALGIVLSHAILRWFFLRRTSVKSLFENERGGELIGDSEEAHLEFMYLRLLEDWLYQAEIRPELTFKLRSEKRSTMNLPLDLKLRCENDVAQKLRDLSEQYLKDFSCKMSVEKVAFPWNRLFDIRIELRKRTF
jgi:hypothetical protein